MRRFVIAAIATGFALAAPPRSADGGDILRGGAGVNERPAGGNPGDAVTAAQTARIISNNRDSLARTAKALTDARAMQNAARAAAVAAAANNAGPDPTNSAIFLPNVPDGLGPGGLHPLAGGVWRGADSPVQSSGAAGVNVRIRQNEPQAVLTWENFNIGRRTTLQFDQSAGGADRSKWIAFNQVNDPSGRPSQILGRIRADGQVYVMNRNGVIFGATSQVNARGLTVSSLPLNYNLVERGLLNNPDAQFLFSALAQAAGANTPGFVPEAPFRPDGRYGDIIVQRGALLTSPTDAANVGGRIALIGANVVNEGAISTPDGQTVLAAGLQVGFAAHPASDPSLRGLDVFVGAVANPASAVAGRYAGTVVNNGVISVPRANASLAGAEVRQLGAITSETSVSLNGRIDLLANFDAQGVPEGVIAPEFPFTNRSTGRVAIGANSVMQISTAPGDARAVGTQLALRSVINVQGRSIHVGAGSSMVAPNASVSLSAGSWKVLGGAVATSQLVNDLGQVYIDRNALMDVSGSYDIKVPVAQNILELELRGSELARSPLQRSGVLRGIPIFVDSRVSGTFNGFSWVGTPLGDVSGFVGLIERTVGELTAAGGDVNIRAGESVVMRSGSKVNVSGGWVEFQGGMVRTTRLLAGGRLLDIAQATPDVVYDGIYLGETTLARSERWGVIETYSHPLALTGSRFEPAYIQGARGGSLVLFAPAMALDGELIGHTVQGPRQRAQPEAGSRLNLAFQAQDGTLGGFPSLSPTPPAVSFGRPSRFPAPGEFSADVLGNAEPLRVERKTAVILSPGLLLEEEGGFSSLTLENSDGPVTVGRGIVLQAPAWGEIRLSGSVVNIAGSLVAPGGTIALTAPNISQAQRNALAANASLPTPDPNPGRGIVTLQAGGSIRTAGLIVDDRPGTAAPFTLPLALDGGSVSITGYSVDLRRRSRVDVSGGVRMGPTTAVRYGAGGSISIAAGRDPNLTFLLGGRIFPGAELLGFSGSVGGRLALLAPAIQIGGRSANPSVLTLPPSFFSEGGFVNFELTGIGLQTDEADVFVPGVRIVRGAVIEPKALGWLATPHLPGGGGVGLEVIERPVGLRSPVRLAFNSVGANNPREQLLLVRGETILEAGARIVTDPLGSVTFAGQSVGIYGSVIAPGGSIQVSGAGSYAQQIPDVTRSLTTVHIGGSAFLSTAGTTVLIDDPRGIRSGFVLPGGSINISGNVVAGRGAVLDVSGTRGVLDLMPTFLTTANVDVTSLNGLQLVPVPIETNAGAISFSGAQHLFVDAQLIGRPGGPNAVGATLQFASGRFIPQNTATTTADINMVVQQSGRVVSPNNFPGGESALGRPVLNAGGGVVPGLGYLAVHTFASGGFNSVRIAGNVRFLGDVTIGVPGAVSLATGGVIDAAGTVQLTAPFVALGQPLAVPLQPEQSANTPPFTRTDLLGITTPFNFLPTFGSGRLIVNASLIEVGNLSLQNIGSARLAANRGDLRGSGTLNIAGEVVIHAGQVYPTTAATWNIAAYDYDTGSGAQPGRIVFERSGDQPLPLSAGGSLNVHATEIEQGGVLRAPFGTIRVGWDGTGIAPVDPISGIAFPVARSVALLPGSATSVSAIDPSTGRGILIPYGIIRDGTRWIDPFGNDITAGGLPVKSITIAGRSVETLPGSIIDLRGGGDLYAYQWVEGIGGPEDILLRANTFAVIPGFRQEFAPFAPFNPFGTELGGDPGYVTSGLRVGDRVMLGASDVLPAGTYALLPARYALLPGAVLVTPQSGDPVGSHQLPDGAWIVSGMRLTNVGGGGGSGGVSSRFELAPASVVRQRADYSDFFANAFLAGAARRLDLPVPRLPADSGQLVFSAIDAMNLLGSVQASAPSGARGALVDISSPGEIVIASDPASIVPAPGRLILGTGVLNSFAAESLLVGGVRTLRADGSDVEVRTASLTLDSSGIALVGSDIVLASRGDLVLGPGSQILGNQASGGALDTLFFGSEALPGSGDGALVRVSGAASRIERSGVSNAAGPNLVIGQESLLVGESLILDSTSATDLDPSAGLEAPRVALNSGRISIQLDDPGPLFAPTSGLILTGQALDTLQETARFLSLLSYSTLDIYGTGVVGSSLLDALEISAGAIRGFNAGGGDVGLIADTVLLQNVSGALSPPPPALPLSGTLRVDAREVQLGRGNLAVQGFQSTSWSAASRVIAVEDGLISAAGDLLLGSPLLTGRAAVRYSLTAAGSLALVRPAGSVAGAVGGLGVSMELQGADVSIDTDVLLPSGELLVSATGGSLLVGTAAAARIDLGGVQRVFNDVSRFTPGGNLVLASQAGNVVVGAGGGISVAGHPAGGNAGSISVSAPQGEFVLTGEVVGSAVGAARSGSFALDAASVGPGGSLAALDQRLNLGGFFERRDIRVRSGDAIVDGSARARDYRVAADAGSILVTGTVDASGPVGGRIYLAATFDLTVASGAVLTVAAERFDSAGKGGHIALEAGAQTNGVVELSALLDLQDGALLDLSVDALGPDSVFFGRHTGTLHLRAPRSAANDSLGIGLIGAEIQGASSIIAEGHRIYDLTGSGTISTAIQTQINNEAAAFMGSASSTTVNYTNMINAILGTDTQGLLPIFVLAPGAEILNRTGSITLGTASSTAAADWNLAAFRYGPKSAPGVLTLRAAGNLVFFNALSDGFQGGSSLWLAPLMSYQSLLPANAQHWSFRLTSGAETSAASYSAVRPVADLAPNSGFVQLGKNAGNAVAAGGNNATTQSFIGNFFQVVRTGTGDIDIAAGRSVQILNPFASIYTAGARVQTPTSIFAPNDFVLPVTTAIIHPQQGSLGAVQQNYTAQYSSAGGNVRISAGQDIERLTRTTGGVLVPDSSRQLPVNYVYRRGYVDPLTGEFGATGVGTGFGAVNDPASSTTWWVSLTIFFQGVGALGGGHVTMIAGRDISNVDAVIPTNARMPRGQPDLDRLVELGGGDLVVRAGRNIDGGVYYVERGSGGLDAGGSVVTNATRSPSRNYLTGFTNPEVFNSLTWLPTTLFLGKGQFDVTARGDVLISPVTNPFLLPAGLNNKFWNKTYFSTFGADSAVRVTSLGGGISLRAEAVLPNETGAKPILQIWLEKANLLPTGNTGAAFSQPWLRLAETAVTPFATLAGLTPSTLEMTALSGDINMTGGISLSPAPFGTLEMLAAGSINALQPAGTSSQLVPGQITTAWKSSSINVSDSSPNAVPGLISPFSYFTIAGRAVNVANTTQPGFLQPVAALFNETGATNSVLQVKQALHAPEILHRADFEPIRVFAMGGSLSGLTLFTPKPARVFASGDITDIGFYFQNVRDGDQSIVSAGRDIVPGTASSPLRLAATTGSNRPVAGERPKAGDIQINGPGSLLVLAGRNLDLGTIPGNADGTGAGITSVGNLRNPFLPAGGANILLVAGIGSAPSLGESSLNFAGFIDDFVRTPEGEVLLAEVAPGIDFDALDPEEQNRLAIEVFYKILRDSGRAFNDPASAGFGGYDQGFAAIESLFGGGPFSGDFLARGRDVRTRSGGDISILVPGGVLTLADTIIGNPLAPPGIVTESGGNIGIFTDGDVDIGIGRIFTLRGGDMVIWSSTGNIAAGSASKTVQSAPPTRVVVDPQSATVETDLGGLATGGGIGVLATVEGVEPGDVDLIAPGGIIDAGDAGIRVSGNINLAATQVVNAGNISIGGTAGGAPAAPAVGAPNVGGLTAAANTAGAATSAASDLGRDSGNGEVSEADERPSIITVEVLGYGGGSDPDEDEDERRRRARDADQAGNEAP